MGTNGHEGWNTHEWQQKAETSAIRKKHTSNRASQLATQAQIVITHTMLLKTTTLTCSV